MTQSPARRWGAPRVLKAMLAAQGLLALLVVAGDLWDSLPATHPAALPADVPIAPGDQTRQFRPDRMPDGLPEGPGFPDDGSLPRRLDFAANPMEGLEDAVLITGMIAPGDAARFADWLQAQAAPPGLFTLHSPGGSVLDALEIGRLIRQSGIPVAIPPGAACFSACPYVLAGGSTREVSRRAMVGLHQHYFDENTYLPGFLMVSDIQAGQGLVMEYLAEMGIDPMVMAKALKTPPEDIYILLPEELETYALATRLTE